MKKGKWSKEEDNLIKSHIEKYGVGRSWQALSNTLGLQRCGRSCRSRWLNYLRPGLKHGNFTPAEETIICEMYSKRGSCWSVIAARLPGRTDLAVNNYWNSTLKKKFSAAVGLCGLQHVNRCWDAGEGPAADFLQQPGELHAGVQPCQARHGRPAAGASSAAAGSAHRRRPRTDHGGPGEDREDDTASATGL
ncbi:hypothetical protein HU200_021441 [Digitaria exilis]|uniref:Uncharacterized protein n=1 Tax=Digitaria exilis TaxID=1010633 RepID=A0A835EZ21_9POAL|nr:hypothetical protein HU200_021441 [Digitaria exilis]